MADGLMHIVRCQSCSVAYLNPRLTEDSTIAVEAESTVYDYSPAEIEQGIEARTGLVAQLEQHCSSRGRLLDVGCNRGLLLEAARRLGWQVTGLELSPVAAQRARDEYGLEIYGRTEDLATLKPFDMIVAWHVLEHTHDPVRFLRQLGRLLQPTGIVAVQVPSFDFLEEFDRRSQSSSLVCEVHAFYLADTSIRSIFQRAGLEPFFVRNDPTDLMLTVVAGKQEAARLGTGAVSTTMSSSSSTQRSHHALSSAESALHARVLELERTIEMKNAHIQQLELLIRRIESGRVMQLLRRLSK